MSVEIIAHMKSLATRHERPTDPDPVCHIDCEGSWVRCDVPWVRFLHDGNKIKTIWSTNPCWMCVKGKWTRVRVILDNKETVVGVVEESAGG